MVGSISLASYAALSGAGLVYKLFPGESVKRLNKALEAIILPLGRRRITWTVPP